MNIDGTFLPVAEELINNVFPTGIRYLRNAGSSYDPATGDVTPNVTQYEISAGVLSPWAYGARWRGGKLRTAPLDSPRHWRAASPADY